MKKDKSVAVVPQKQEVAPVNNSVESFISQAIATGAPVETLRGLYELRKDMKAEFAEEQFSDQMAELQGEFPTITKTKSVSTKMGKVAYRYAPLESIVEQTKKLIKDYGFSYSIRTETLADKVKVTCIVRHKLGHKESTDVTVPLGTKTEIMSNTQVVAAALTFAKRYAFCNAFGIMTGDEDTDSRTPETHGENGNPDLSGLPKPVRTVAPKTVAPQVITPTPVPPTIDDKHLSDFAMLLETSRDASELDYFWKTIPVHYQKALVPTVAEVKRRFASAAAATPTAPTDLGAKRESLKS